MPEQHRLLQVITVRLFYLEWSARCFDLLRETTRLNHSSRMMASEHNRPVSTTLRASPSSAHRRPTHQEAIGDRESHAPASIPPQAILLMSTSAEASSEM